MMQVCQNTTAAIFCQNGKGLVKVWTTLFLKRQRSRNFCLFYSLTKVVANRPNTIKKLLA